MLPKGGNLFWGHDDSAPDDSDNIENKIDNEALGTHSNNQTTEQSTKKSKFRHSHGKIVTFLKKRFINGVEDITLENDTDSSDTIEEDDYQHYTMDDALELLYSTASNDFLTMIKSNYSTGVSTSPHQLEANAQDHTKWSNPLETQLPKGKG
jgi:phospholipid:diacylglycerol acyltransferase